MRFPLRFDAVSPSAERNTLLIVLRPWILSSSVRSAHCDHPHSACIYGDNEPIHGATARFQLNSQLEPVPEAGTAQSNAVLSSLNDMEY